MMIVCQPLAIMIKVKMRIVKMMRPSWLGLMKTGDALDKEVTGPTGLYCSVLQKRSRRAHICVWWSDPLHSLMYLNIYMSYVMSCVKSCVSPVFPFTHPLFRVGWLAKRDIFTRPSVAGAVLQTPPSLIQSASDPFPPNLQNTITPKPLELRT